MPLAVVGQTAVGKLVAGEDDEVELTDVVVLGVVDLLLLPHAATTVAKLTNTDPTTPRVPKVMSRMFVEPIVAA